MKPLNNQGVVATATSLRRTRWPATALLLMAILPSVQCSSKHRDGKDLSPNPPVLPTNHSLLVGAGSTGDSLLRTRVVVTRAAGHSRDVSAETVVGPLALPASR